MKPLDLNALIQRPGLKIYLVGAGGSGMSALGHLLLDQKHRVAGSDLIINEEIQGLLRRGAEIHQGHSGSRILAWRPDLLVYSSAIRLKNPELQAAQETGTPIAHRATVLAALVKMQRGICVAGMHGKTTTSALLAFSLERLLATPSYAVGALVPQLSAPARFSLPQKSEAERPCFVVEVDESDGSLRQFFPECSIVLNVDQEHLDYYKNLEAVCREFEGFGRQTSASLFFCADDPQLAQIYSARPDSVSFGYHPLAGYRIANWKCHLLGSSFEIWHEGRLFGSFTLLLRGEKNISNAAAVIALLHRLEYSAEKIAEVMAEFKGVARRQQELFRNSAYLVFEDYAHHPSEIQATLKALRPLARRRLLVVFQPHRFSRTQYLLPHFATCFQEADLLWLTPIYAAHEEEIPGVNSDLLAEAIRSTGKTVEGVKTLDALPGALEQKLEPGDVVVFLGAGDITVAAHDFGERLRSRSVTPAEDMVSLFTKKLSSNAIVKRNEPLARKTTLRVGGAADFYLEPASEEDLAAILEICQANQLPFVLLGRGSNLLIRDGGIRGVVICLAQPNFSRIEVNIPWLSCGAGARLRAVAVEAKRHGLSGLEFLEGIPGSVGGAMRMNAGAMGSWMFDCVDRIRFMDYSGKIHEQRSTEVNVEYRGCPLFKNHIALGAILKGDPAVREAIDQKMRQCSEKRWTSQPAAPSAGCIFKNPSSIPAGKLIDELGLKGIRVGGAIVSDVHGNFIVNDGNATARDVLNLIEIIKQRAQTQRGIELHTEVEIIGEN